MGSHICITKNNIILEVSNLNPIFYYFINNHHHYQKKEIIKNYRKNNIPLN